MVALLFASLAAFWLLPITLNPVGVPFWRNAGFSDLLVSHLPNAIFLNRAVKIWSQIPLWNPTILSGYPFIADPLAGIWYPPLWIAAVFPVPLTFNLLFWVHLVWAGLGMWGLCRKEGLSNLAALFGGLVFASAPKWIAHIGLGHIGLVCAVSWTPWLLLHTSGSILALSTGGKPAFRKTALNGLLLAIVFFADPRWLLPALVLMLLYAAHLIQKEKIDLRSRSIVAFRWAGLTGVFALGSAAGFAIALVQFVTNSTRGLIDQVGADPFALHWQDFAGLVTLRPDQPEKLIYLGVGVSFFAIVGLLLSRRWSWFWAITVVLGLLISMGANLPILGTWLHSLPTASLLRVPPRWFFMTILAASYFAGAGLDALLKAPIRDKIYFRSILIFIILAGAILLLDNGQGSPVLLLTLPAVVLMPLILLRRSGWLGPQPFLMAALIVLSLEIGLVSLLVLETRSTPTNVVEDPGEFGTVMDTSGGGRVFSPSFSVDPLFAAERGLELADGVHPLQLESYWIYMARSTGFDAQEYSVTLPPFPSGDPDEPWAMDLDLDALARLNVSTIVAAYPLSEDDLLLVSATEHRFVYTLDSFRPRAWVHTDGGEQRDWEAAQISYWSPNRIELVAGGPGMLVLSEIAYPGWKVHVDGVPSPGVVVDGLLRGVELEAGEHRVLFSYRPTNIWIGISVTLLTLLAVVYIQVKR
jgi:hypothetical protein